MGSGPDRRRRKELVAAWKAEQRRPRPPAVELPDWLPRACPQCAGRLELLAVTQLSGVESATLWEATCAGCRTYFRGWDDGPDRQPVWQPGFAPAAWDADAADTAAHHESA